MISKTSGKATATHIRKHNESLLLKEIYANQEISRVQLARLTHLSRPAVTELIHGLLERELVTELGPEQSAAKVGKPAMLLALNPDAYHIVTIVISETELIGSLLDLRMCVRDQETAVINGVLGSQLLDKVMELTQTMIGRATRPLLGIGVGTPGIVDSQAGIVHLAVNLGWEQLPLAHLLAERFQLPVYIDNDTNLAAVGEYRFGLGKGIDDLTVIMVGTGIGAGILAGGQIVRGSVFAAGELGHIPFPNLTEMCMCGRRGCLETVVSWWGLLRQAQRIAEEHPESLLNQLADGGTVTRSIIREAIRQGDPEAVALAKSAGYMLGQALITVIHLLNPKQIIITGGLIQLGEPFINQVHLVIDDCAIPYMANQTDILPSKLGITSILLGAGALLLEKELGL